MDYTTLARVKAAEGGVETGDDTLLATFITNASRAIDRYCGGCNQALDYFALKTVTNESETGRIDQFGCLHCWPRVAVVNSVTALAYRMSPQASWSSFDINQVTIEGAHVIAWSKLDRVERVLVSISYQGGFGATVDTLPADLVEAATVMTIRFHREARTGMSDAVGVAELGMLTYTKAWPVRVTEMLAPFRRVVPW